MVSVRIVWQEQSFLVGFKIAKLYAFVVGIVLLSKHSTGHLFHTLGLAHGVEVQGRYAGGLELFCIAECTTQCPPRGLPRRQRAHFLSLSG